jgi:RnfABCDGE-type electron transport complex B subunit
MVEALLLMGGMGVIIGIGLAFASKIFYVYVDPLVEKIEGLLPGANCGGCGLPGCSANAVAIATGKASPGSCVAGGADLALVIAEALGKKLEVKEPDIALPGCTYGVKDAKIKFSYNGISSCQAAAMLYGGMKECQIGCLGLGSCLAACPFGALKMGENGLPVVDEAKCTGCGTCERVCPKHIITLSSVTRRILKEYTTEDCTTPCQRACPAGINISEYIRLIAEKKYHESVQVIKERNPFPTVIGRICPRPCENDCRRQLVDEPVAINFLKRFVADYEMKSNNRILPYKAPETDIRIALVGGGVEGLSTAFFCARLGHTPTVFEASPQLGGLLRTAIAQYRLPSDILDWDIEGIMEMGVKAETKKVLGKDFTISSLLAGDYKAVFLALGGWDSRTERLKDTPPEPAVPGTHLLIDLLKTGPENKYRLSMGESVVIAESGHLTADAVAACKKLGAKKIIVVFKNTRENAGLHADTIKQLQADNVSLVFHSTITQLAGTGNILKEIVVSDISSHESVAVPANTLVIDSGRIPELIFTLPEPPKDADESALKKVPADKTPWIAVPASKNPEAGPAMGLLSKGDVITDFSAAIRAIGAGRRAAASIHKVLYGIPLELPAHVVTATTILQNVTHLENVTSVPRQIMPLNPVNDIPKKATEIEGGFTEEMAVAEAGRCLNCGLICYNDRSVQIMEKAS